MTDRSFGGLHDLSSQRRLLESRAGHLHRLRGTPHAPALAPLALAVGLLEVDPPVLVPLANVLGAERAEQARPCGVCACTL
jgi:hypothetical protein